MERGQTTVRNKKSPANAKGNVQQRCIFESPVKQNQSPDDRWLYIYSVLLVLTRGRYLSRSANAVSAENHKFSLPLSHLVPSFRVTPLKFMEKLYGSWN